MTGAAPGNVAGLFQINVKLPAGLSGNVPVAVTVGSVASQAGLTAAVKQPNFGMVPAVGLEPTTCGL